MQLVTLFLLVILDQLSKIMVLKSGFSYVTNRGIAFSLLSYIPSSVIFVALLIFIGFFWKEIFRRNNVLWILALSGGVSNLIDRVRLGYVIDFIHIWIFPVFNLADLFIVIAFVGIIYESTARNNLRK